MQGNPAPVGHRADGVAAPLSDQPIPLRHDAEGNAVYADWDEATPQPDQETIEEANQEFRDKLEQTLEEHGEMEEPAVEEPKLTKRQREKAERELARRNDEVARIEEMTDEDLLAEAGIEPIFSTTEAAEFFDRSNQWLYWGLREGIFTDASGKPIDPERVGNSENGRRRFTLPIIREILKSSYRRGNFEDDEVKKIVRRIKYAELGVEWREREGGWTYVQLGKKHARWVKSELAYQDADGVWRLKPDQKLESDDDREAQPVSDDDFVDVADR